ncbi:glycosyltransferase family 4 protein [Salinimicrobium sp. TH3]|uniref:glycosyltransferase family 4 protein n=1 Tax=Salinimicrobium sp. TH3 TaxID=2997342 RepID=UPI00227373CC|nr:glycosyltransferase family 4 protein [Salinimicrobium sp. TH3]MCY2686974.1 glycosyltransferase family 4 protein [Salinimicrobium sp. TH3]
MKKLIRITTVPLSLEKLLEGQLNFMQREYEVIAVSSEKNKLNELGREIGVRTYPVAMTREITPIKDLGSLWYLYRFLKKEKPLIVHTHTPKAGVAGMIAAKMAGVPLRLHTVAGLPLLEAQGLKKKMLEYVEKVTFASATHVYPNSVQIYKYLKDKKFASKDKLKVIGKGSSNGIDTGYFDPSLFPNEENLKIRKSVGIPENDLVFIFVGRLVRDKGINELVEAFDKVNKEFPETSLLLVGPFEAELDPLKPEIIEKMSIHSKIKEVGYQSDVRPFFSIADVLTFPSYREGFPNVVMQAGAMGLTSIVTDINGCNEIIKEGVNGTIIPVKNTKALYDAMKKMIVDEEFRKSTGAKSRKLIKENFERREVWKALLAEYKRLEAQL